MKIKGFDKLTKKRLEAFGKEASKYPSLIVYAPTINSRKKAKKLKMFTICAPVGSIVIPKSKIRETFKKMFDAGWCCNDLYRGNMKMHGTHFEKTFNKMKKLYSKIKPK